MDERTSEASRAARVAGTNELCVLLSMITFVPDFCSWDSVISSFNAEMSVKQLALHSTQSFLIVADDTNIVRSVFLPPKDPQT